MGRFPDLWLAVNERAFGRAFPVSYMHDQDVKVTLKHIYISPGHNYYGRHGIGSMDFPIEEKDSIVCLEGRGIEDDRFLDYKEDYKGQITFFDWAVYEKVRDEIVKGELDPVAFRRNVMVQGIDLNDLIDKHFSLGGLEFTGSCECSPCYWMDEACAPGTHEFLKGRGGLRARIVKGGELATGEYELKILGDVERREDANA